MKHSVKNAVVLAAGKGTRMRGLCRSRPKPMLPLVNRPFLVHILDGLCGAGIERVLLVVGHQSEQIRAFFADGGMDRMEVEFVQQRNPNGTGSAAGLARDFARGEPFMLVFGDIITSRANYTKMTQQYAAYAPDALLSTRYVHDPYRGAAVYVEGRRVVRIEEKPPKGTAKTHWDNAGLFVFPPTIFEMLERLKPSPRGEYELTDALHAIIEAGMRLEACEMEGFWENVTGPEELIRTNRLLMEEMKAREEPLVANGARISQNAAISPQAAVAEDTEVNACTLGENVSVGVGARIDADARVENTIILPRAQIGKGARLAWCVVNEGTQVADGTAVRGRPHAVEIVE